MKKYQVVRYSHDGVPMHMDWFATLDEVGAFLKKAADPIYWYVYEVARMVEFHVESRVVFP